MNSTILLDTFSPIFWKLKFLFVLNQTHCVYSAKLLHTLGWQSFWFLNWWLWLISLLAPQYPAYSSQWPINHWMNEVFWSSRHRFDLMVIISNINLFYCDSVRDWFIQYYFPTDSCFYLFLVYTRHWKYKALNVPSFSEFKRNFIAALMIKI